MQIIHENQPIHYEISGKGKAIIFLHGFLENLSIWKKYAEILSSNFCVIAIDLPGHGQTGILSNTHTMEFMAECVNQILIQHNIEKCALIGHSMGGYVSLAFAEKYANKVAGICLFHSTAKADSNEKKLGRERAIAVVENNHTFFISQAISSYFSQHNAKILKTEIEKLIEIGKNTTKSGIIAALQGMKNRVDRTHILSNPQIPFFFIVGKNDPILNFELSLNEIAIPDQCLTLLLEKAGHVGFIEAEIETQRAIKTCCEFFFFQS